MTIVYTDTLDDVRAALVKAEAQAAATAHLWCSDSWQEREDCRGDAAFAARLRKHLAFRESIEMRRAA